MDNCIPATPSLMMCQHLPDTIVSLRRTQAKEILNTPSVISKAEAIQCKSNTDAVTQALKAYYHQPDARFTFNEALEALITLAECSQKTFHVEQHRNFLELSNKSSFVLYVRVPDDLGPTEMKTSAYKLLCQPPGIRANLGLPRGTHKTNNSNNRTIKEPNQGPRGPSLKRGMPNKSKNQKKIGIVEPVEFFMNWVILKTICYIYQ